MKPFNGVKIGLNDLALLLTVAVSMFAVACLTTLAVYLSFGVLGGAAGVAIGSVIVAGTAVGLVFIIHECYGVVSRIRSGQTW